MYHITWATRTETLNGKTDNKAGEKLFCCLPHVFTCDPSKIKTVIPTRDALIPFLLANTDTLCSSYH